MIIKFPFKPDNCIPNAISPEFLSQHFGEKEEKNYLINEFLGGNNNVNIAKQQSFGIN